MLKANIRNEQIKRKYYKYLREAEGYSDTTIDCINKAILVYEEFIRYEEFSKKFNPDRVIEFKEWLRKREFRGKIISLVTFYAYIRNLRKFFTWLCGQPGFRSCIKTDVISYLKMKHSEETIATQNVPREFPELDHIIKLTGSIVCETEIDKRDRALIAFTVLTGMRDTAIVTLPLKCIDINKRIIYQNPKEGVKTKFSKYIESIIFRFDEKLLEYVSEWIIYLKEKDFKGKDPLFPRSKVNQDKINISFDTATEVEPVFWSGAGPMRTIFKKRSQDACLKYYPPHTYRHLAIDLALKCCNNDWEKMKAVSQNYGHEHLKTTVGSYGNYPPQKLTEVLNKIDFSGKSSEIEGEKIKKLKEFVNDL